MEMHPATAMFVFLSFLPGATVARDWRITADGTGDAPTIQAGVDSATSGDRVVVVAGVYTWGSQGATATSAGPTMLHLNVDIELVSESGAALTILDAEEMGRVIMTSQGTAGLIRGFTIRGGRVAATPSCPTVQCGLGGGILCRALSTTTIEECIILDNWASADGGGIALDHANSRVVRNVIARNATSVGGGFGGGVSVSGSTTFPQIVENTIVGNLGTGIAFGDGYGRGHANIVARTRRIGPFGGSGITCAFAMPELSCNILWDNEGGDDVCELVNDNVLVDPQFCSPEPELTGNYLLQADSPALPAGNACGVRIGALDSGCGNVATLATTWSRLKAIYQR